MQQPQGRLKPIIAVALGSFGDVHPIVGVARALQVRGHDVEFLANPLYQDLARRNGLRLTPVGETAELIAAIEDPRMWEPLYAARVLAERLIVPNMRPIFDHVRGRATEHPVVLAPVTAFGARIAREKFDIRLATMGLQPVLIRGREDSPGLPIVPRGPLLRGPARLMRSAVYRAVDALLFDPALAKPTNAFRAELGLPPVRRIFHEWVRSPDLFIGLFPEWFGEPQADWPKTVETTGFPLFDEAEHREFPAALEAFLRAGEPPVVFTPGTANRRAGEFFKTSAEACRRAGLRGLFVSHFAEQIPADLPDSIAHFEYVPFSRLLPRAACLVHHGGIGTAAQALAAGVPQLVVPASYDQPDNAGRLERLGVARVIYPLFYRPARVAAALGRLIASSAVAEACRRAAQKIDREEALEKTVRLVEAL